MLILMLYEHIMTSLLSSQTETRTRISSQTETRTRMRALCKHAQCVCASGRGAELKYNYAVVKAN